MRDARRERIAVAGAGIAGLSAAIAFSGHGFRVAVLERASSLEEAGAGIQLSPNATRILDQLGVLPLLATMAARPAAVVLRRADTLARIAEVPLGDFAEQRWGSPYLVVHRADLQAALLARAKREKHIQIRTGTSVEEFSPGKEGISVLFRASDGDEERMSASLLVGADGVRSALRQRLKAATAQFAGVLAWRRMLDAADPPARPLLERGAAENVTAFLHKRFHLIAYPVRQGKALNLAAFTFADVFDQGSLSTSGAAPLRQALASAAPDLALFGELDGWTPWPVFSAPLALPWTNPAGLALIGDAAHAMTPFAAQGAAMAIEDAATLAACVAAEPRCTAAALRRWEDERRPRILRVARRGRLNRLAWHAAGPVALARDLFLRLRSPERLAADLDWLYGWRPDRG